ncbi:class I adenylate-forming enzyme family protein [Mesorhizobium sophorae]|uniref:class I adenylate-forming enzyme family protein n=1 Tax=Mesorhizobium sophorae TaxID=1300294 RepID=UPI001FD9AA14|nr:class I adenylate-forming enzyme family protein [Mesorhizobium sophorae]
MSDPRPMGLHGSSAVRAAAAGPTVASLFRDSARANAASPAIVGAGNTISYGMLNERVNRLASALRHDGVMAGDRVAIVSENRSEYIEIVLACAKIGAIAACQNWRQAAPELAHCLRLVEPRFIFASPRFAEAAASLGLAYPLALFGDGYEHMLDTGSPQEPDISASAEDGLLILYTSGTTGLPKGAVISHRAIIARALVMMADWAIRPSDGSIAWSPLFHMAAADPALAALCHGAPVYIVDGFDADAIAQALAEIDVGWFVLMPGMIERMIEAQRRAPNPPRRVAAAGCMANLVPPAQIAEISRLVAAPFLNSFGSTETGIAPASGDKIPAGALPTSFAKRQTSFCEIRLVDEDDREVAIGEVGEMTLRSPTLFSGYWNAPEVTERDFRGGWFHMGDDFIHNADGTLTFVDRRKYLIKSGGENIYPAELELVLRDHKRIREAIVVRQPHRRWGEVPVAFVVPADDGLTADDVIAFLDGKVARYKLPKRVIFVRDEELERNATGKIQRQPLEQRLASEAEARP